MTTASQLHARYLALLETTPSPRARDAAASLGVSEAELVEAKAEAGLSRRLRPDPERGFAPILEAMEGVGEVMILTRNEACVHERHGSFANVNIGKVMGLVLNRSVDLRLFMNRWGAGFAVEEEVKSGTRRSLQFFDHAGDAIHKIYVTAKTDRAAFEAVIDAWLDPSPDPLRVEPVDAPAADRADNVIDLNSLRNAWEAMTDVHQFHGMLREHEVGRQQALRLIGEDLAYQLDNDAVTRMLNFAAARAVPIMCFVGNRGCIQIHTGAVKNIKPMGPWINVLDPEFNLHLRTDMIANTWVVRKPTGDGVITSLELFAKDGSIIASFFGERERGRPELTAWREVLADLEPEAVA